MTGTNGFDSRYFVKVILKHGHDICVIDLTASGFFITLMYPDIYNRIIASEKLRLYVNVCDFKTLCYYSVSKMRVCRLLAISNKYQSF